MGEKPSQEDESLKGLLTHMRHKLVCDAIKDPMDGPRLRRATQKLIRGETVDVDAELIAPLDVNDELMKLSVVDVDVAIPAYVEYFDKKRPRGGSAISELRRGSVIPFVVSSGEPKRSRGRSRTNKPDGQMLESYFCKAGQELRNKEAEERYTQYMDEEYVAAEFGESAVFI